jgi:Arc/MetJ-type ribon-helix-helix transcriptional regulator
MTIELPPDLEELARTKVEAGEYPDVPAVLRAGLEALELLDEPEDDAWLANARQRFEDGRAAVERGEYFQGSPREVVARARKRVEARVKST